MKPLSHTTELFGTDGIRGTPGVYPLTDAMLAKICAGIADCLLLEKGGKKGGCVIIGKDTRLSGHKIEALLASAFTGHGINVYLSGTITTPGLSFLVKSLKCDMGIMISASHNKPTDNGLKLFTRHGHKLSAQEEKRIEGIILNRIERGHSEDTPSKRKGTITTLKNSQERYIEFLISTVKGLDLKGVSIALDCAWGAAAPFAKKVFHALGATVHPIHDTPSGHHINKGGAMNPELLRKLVLKSKADIGIALDGDGDRGVLIDEQGTILDGDFILAIMASYLMKHNKLAKNTLVTTVMSNYGLRSYIERLGGKIITTDVGDKHVLEAILRHSLNLGGEQSGHIIFLDYSSAPDGLITALQVLKVMRQAKSSLSELAQCISKFPQILVNVKVKDKRPFDQMPLVSERLAHFNTQLKDEGRILLRYSGTESLARVMVEGKDRDLITGIANTLAEHIKREIGQL